MKSFSSFAPQQQRLLSCEHHLHEFNQAAALSILIPGFSTVSIINGSKYLPAF
jgi:hypothetical protein